MKMMAVALRANIDCKSVISFQRSQFDTKFKVKEVAHSPPPTIFSQITRLNDLSYGIKIWRNFSFLLSQFTPLSDIRTDRHLSGD